ncbi:uncharacterized protein [Ciconia boyciana]|uniref:uncharacterized protein n=1 Tax=Ciconia boyciana TaxID=52775 RepID=UPI003B9DFC4D
MSGLMLPTGTHPPQAPWYITGSRDPSPGCGVGDGQLSALPRTGQLGFRALVGGFWGSIDLPPSSKLAKPPWFWHQDEGREGSCLAGTRPGFAVVTASALARCPCSRQGGKGQALGAVAEPHCCQRGRDCLQQGRGAKPARSPVPSLQHRQGLEARGCLWLTASAGSRGAGQRVPGEGWACQMCVHSWGDGVPTPLSCSQPLSSYFNPKAGPLVPPEPLLHIGGVGVAARHSGAFSDGFDYFLYLRFLHLSPPKKGAGWALLRAVYLPAQCCLLRPLKDLAPSDHRRTHWLACRETNQHGGRVGVPASSSPLLSLSFPRPSWQEGIGHRAGDRDPREHEGLAGLAHRGEAKGLWLLPLKTSAGEARGRGKLFKLPYNVDIRTTRYKLPVHKAGLGIRGFFAAGGGGLGNYPLAEGRRVLSSAPGYDGCLQPLSFAPFPPGLTSVGTRGAPNSPILSSALSPAPGEQETWSAGPSASPQPHLPSTLAALTPLQRSARPRSGRKTLFPLQ